MRSLPVTAEQVQDFRALLAVTGDGDGAGADPVGLIDLIAALEELKATACAVQAEASVAYAAARRSARAAEGVPAARQGRGIAAEVALARRESPHRGQLLLGLAAALRTEMPHALARLKDGSLSEFRATLLARETACLEVELRMFVDKELCADRAALDGVGTRELVGRVKRMVAELDPAAVVRRARQAEADRNVTVRPAPDTMGYLSGLMPLAQAVAAYAALRRGAEAAREAGDPRSMGQLMADLLLARVTGVADTGIPEAAPAVPVTVDITISEESLAGGHGAAELSADGVAGEVVPAEVARHLISAGADAEVLTWFRLLHRNRAGRLIAMSTRQRFHSRAMAKFLALRGGGICATPFCDAPIRHADHIDSVEGGGETSIDNGQGLCEACNHAKQGQGWHQRVVSGSGERHRVETTTPSGHRYRATAPAPPGFVLVG